MDSIVKAETLELLKKFKYQVATQFYGERELFFFPTKKEALAKSREIFEHWKSNPNDMEFTYTNGLCDQTYFITTSGIDLSEENLEWYLHFEQFGYDIKSEVGEEIHGETGTQIQQIEFEWDIENEKLIITKHLV